MDLCDLGPPGGHRLLVRLPPRGSRQGIVVAEPRPGEERLEPVEIRLADRVELVVVAAGAADRQAEEDQAGRLGDVVERILAPQPLVVQVDHVGIAAVEPGGDEGGRILGSDLVAGELEPDEPVIRHVAVRGRRRPSRDIARHWAGPGRTRSRRCRRSAPGRASAAPGAPRIAGWPAGGRRPSRKHRASGRRGTPSTSSGDGGRPVRSKQSRRSSVGRSASGAGARSLDSSPARMKASIGFLTQPLSGRPAARPRRGGRNAQWSRSSAVIGLSGTLASSAAARAARPRMIAIEPRGARSMGLFLIRSIVPVGSVRASPPRGSRSGGE